MFFIQKCRNSSLIKAARVISPTIVNSVKFKRKPIIRRETALLDMTIDTHGSLQVPFQVIEQN